MGSAELKQLKSPIYRKRKKANYWFSIIPLSNTYLLSIYYMSGTEKPYMVNNIKFSPSWNFQLKK